MACVNHPENMETQTCPRCSRDFCKNCLVEIKGQTLCGSCKNEFLRDIQSGTNVLSYRFAGFWIRFLAVFIDGILLNVIYQPINIGVNIALGTMNPGTSNPASALMIIVPIALMMFNMVLTMSYYTFFHGKYGQTPGKMACKIKVINQDGTPISFLKAFGRYWGYFLSSLLLQIGNIMAGFDEEKRALHDRICSTYVIYKDM